MKRPVMELSVAQAQEKIVGLELDVERLRTALTVIYEISQDRLTPAWQALEKMA
jgi:predicted ester cyclase